MNYTQTAIKAARSLAKAGAIVSASWQTAAEPYKPGQPPPQPVQHAHSAAGLVLAYADRDIGVAGDTLAAAGDERLYLAVLAPDLATPVPPLPFGARVVLADGGVRFVKNCKPLAPAGVRVMYDITLRR